MRVIFHLTLLAGTLHGEALKFNRDIRPILSAKCIACHGPDEKHREGGLRLDTAEGALAPLKEDIGHAIVPGDPAASALIKRIKSQDPNVVMPPPKFHKEVTEEELATLEQWIEQGAEYESHWSYTPLTRPAVPKLQKHAALACNPIDAFILKKLEDEGVEPSPVADTPALLRRIALDLTGLPPAIDGPKDPNKAIEEALASSAYGERMAVPWLDVVRFADTVGYHGDQNQRVFPYRDYVIRSLNENKPYDQFVREQLAGDLLPNATEEQHIASGFNRLNLVTREGGAQSKEYFKKSAADRVRAVGTAFLGQTIGCAECHNHKYDPITAKDFYSMAAFFDDVQQWGVYNGYTPGAKYNGNNDAYTPERIIRSESQLARLSLLQQQAIDLLNGHAIGGKDITQALAELRAFADAHPTGWAPLKPLSVAIVKSPPPAPDPEKTEKPKAKPKPAAQPEPTPIRMTSKVSAEDSSIQFSGPPVTDEMTAIDFEVPGLLLRSIQLEALPDPSTHGQIGREPGGHFTLKPSLYLVETGPNPAPPTLTPLKVRWSQANLDRENGFAGGLKHGDRNTLQLDTKHGWQSAPKPAFEGPGSLTSRKQTAVLCLDQPVTLKPGTKLRLVLGVNTASRIRLSHSPVLDPVPGEPAFTTPLLNSLRNPAAPSWAAYHLCFTPTTTLPTEYQSLLKQIRDCRSGWTRTLVTVRTDQPEFPSRILHRGDWQDDSGELVEPSVLSFLPSDSLPKDRKLTRLDLANWITAEENPLAARHFVNRLWKQFFGRGLSNILDDLGGQGEPPTHPDLLDWLAAEFRESGWDMKHLVRLITQSNTYRQSAASRADLLESDPYNRLYAQQTGRRLDAEFIRDQALSAANLLDRSFIGGPSIRIYQPDNYYTNLNFPVRKYSAHLDARQHRRSVYAHWQRTFLLPTFANFDAPARDECAADRLQANIPQQALTLLNDPVYVEASRGLAARVLTELPEASPEEQLTRMFQHLLARNPDKTEQERLLGFLEKQRTQFSEGVDQPDLFLGIGIAKVPDSMDRIELAAWTQTARLLLNLHESITRY